MFETHSTLQGQQAVFTFTKVLNYVSVVILPIPRDLLTLFRIQILLSEFSLLPT